MSLKISSTVLSSNNMKVFAGVEGIREKISEVQNMALRRGKEIEDFISIL